MAVTPAHILDQQPTAQHGNGPYTSASFTPTAGRRLLVFVNSHDDTGISTSIHDKFTISDSQGLTWTRIGSVGGTAGTNWPGLAVWFSSPVAATAMTVTIDCDSIFLGRPILSVSELDGFLGLVRGLVTNGSRPADGGYSFDMEASHASGELAVFGRGVDDGSRSGNGGASLDMPSGWTVHADRYDENALNQGAFAFATNSTLLDNTVTVDDTNLVLTASTATYDIAFILSDQPPPVEMRRGGGLFAV